MSMNKFFIVLLFVGIFFYSLIASEQTKIWELKDLRKINNLEGKDINPNYCIFYKIEMSNDKGEKKAFILGKTVERQTEKNKIYKSKKCKKSNFKEKSSIHRKGSWKIVSIKKSDDIQEFFYFSDYFIFYKTEISDDYNDQLFML